MSALSALKAVLDQFDFPAEPGEYSGTEKTFATYNYADRHVADHGDDLPGCFVASVQVHYFTPIWKGKRKASYTKTMNDICRALIEAGFVGLDVEPIEEKASGSSEKGADRSADLWHIVFSCEYEEEI
jgi:hypothetical protein